MWTSHSVFNLRLVDYNIIIIPLAVLSTTPTDSNMFLTIVNSRATPFQELLVFFQNTHSSAFDTSFNFLDSDLRMQSNKLITNTKSFKN